MNGKEIERKYHQTFEDLKQENNAGMEFWYARDLQTVLDYSTWDKFKRVIQKAVTACENSGQPAENHFSQVVKMVRIGSSAQWEIEDFELSRYGCYLIVQNGDPTKPVIANGQTYFAIQTRRQELAANLFRTTQTEEKLRREGIKGKTKANLTHFEVGGQGPSDHQGTGRHYAGRPSCA